MSTIKIDKDVPMPRKWSKRGEYAETLRTMEVGDSFILGAGNRTSVASAMQTLKPCKFAIRTVEVDGAKALRVWRVE